MEQGNIKLVVKDGVMEKVSSPEWIIVIAMKDRFRYHENCSIEVVLADKRKIEIEEDNEYTFYYTREDLKDVDKYIEWIKSVV